MTHRRASRTAFPSLHRALLALSVSAIAAALLWPAAELGAQAPTLNGMWRLATDPGQAQASISQSIEPALGALRPDLQQVARARIAESTWVPSTITVASTPARISIDFVGAEHRTFDSAPGAPQNVYSRSGVRAQLTQSYRPDGGIQQQFVALDGTQWNNLLPDASGQRMVLDVTLRSQRFTHDIQFRLAYVR